MSTPVIQTPPMPTPALPDLSLERHLAEMRRLHEQLEQLVRELRGQVAALEAECSQLRNERDSYRKSLSELTWKDCTFEASELEEMEKSGVTLDQLVTEIETAARG